MERRTATSVRVASLRSQEELHARCTLDESHLLFDVTYCKVMLALTFGGPSAMAHGAGGVVVSSTGCSSARDRERCRDRRSGLL